MQWIEAAAAVVVTALATAAPLPVEEPLWRAAAGPTPLERQRMAAWHRAWLEEAAPVERSFRALHRAAAGETPVALRPHCLALAEDLLDLDRRRVLPVPDPAADLHLRRGLRELGQAAVTCLGKRPYATRQALAEAASALRHVDRILGPYGLELRAGRLEP